MANTIVCAMADVDMTDAPGSGPASKKKTSSAVDADSKGDSKKRFEVKKVHYSSLRISVSCCIANAGMSSGTLSRCGHGILSSTTVPSVEITSWIYVSIRDTDDDIVRLANSLLDRYRVSGESSICYK